MGRKELKRTEDNGPGLNPDDLRGRQSVRATFRLPVQVIELLTVAAAQLGVQQKSLFDQLMEERTVLGQIAGRVREKDSPGKQRLQKTMVLSRNTLELLNEMAKKHGVARDILVEASIRRLGPVMSTERKKHEIRKHLLESLIAYRDKGRALMEKTEGLLGRDDPVYGEMSRMMENCSLAVEQVGDFVERGKCLDRIVKNHTHRPQAPR